MWLPIATTARLNSWTASWRSTSSFVVSARTQCVSVALTSWTTRSSASMPRTSVPDATNSEASDRPNLPRPSTTTLSSLASRRAVVSSRLKMLGIAVSVRL